MSNEVSSAVNLLNKAKQHMEDRAATYDRTDGERSMEATVKAFNAITHRNLTESEGWLFMTCLKQVRAFTSTKPHQDSIEDLIAYSALMGESMLKGN